MDNGTRASDPIEAPETAAASRADGTNPVTGSRPAPASSDKTDWRAACVGGGAEETPVYGGMHWTAVDAEAGVLQADSEITPARYLVEVSGVHSTQGRVRLYVTYDREQDPERLHEGVLAHALLGEYRGPEAAVDAAELHDWHFFVSLAMAQGEEPAFQGSTRSASLEADDLSILMTHAGPAIGHEAATAPDGRPFTRAASFLRASKTKLDQNADGSMKLTLTVARGELPLWLIEAPYKTLLMLGAVAMGSETDPEGEEHARRIKAIMVRAAARPTESAFQEFMAAKYDRWGLIKDAMRKDSDATEEAVAETLRRVVGVPTRSDLEINVDARQRFERIDREYYEDAARSVRHWEAVHDRV